MCVLGWLAGVRSIESIGSAGLAGSDANGFNASKGMKVQTNNIGLLGSQFACAFLLLEPPETLNHTRARPPPAAACTNQNPTHQHNTRSENQPTEKSSSSSLSAFRLRPRPARFRFLTAITCFRGVWWGSGWGVVSIVLGRCWFVSLLALALDEMAVMVHALHPHTQPRHTNQQNNTPNQKAPPTIPHRPTHSRSPWAPAGSPDSRTSGSASPRPRRPPRRRSRRRHRPGPTGRRWTALFGCLVGGLCWVCACVGGRVAMDRWTAVTPKQAGWLHTQRYAYSTKGGLTSPTPSSPSLSIGPKGGSTCVTLE